MSAPRDTTPSTEASDVTAVTPDIDTLRQFEEVAPGSSLKIIEANLRVQIEHEYLDRTSLRYDKQIRSLTVILQFVQYALSACLSGFLFYKQIVWPGCVIIAVPILSSLITELRGRRARHPDGPPLGDR